MIYKDNASALKPEAYEVHRLLQVANQEGVDVQVAQGSGVFLAET